MDEIKEFKNVEFGNIRVMTINNKEYFVANDIAKALGYKKPNDAVNQHCRSMAKYKIPHPQNNNKIMKANIISEDDVINLIMNCKIKTDTYKTNLLSWLINSKLINNKIVMVNNRKEIKYFEKLKNVFISLNLELSQQYHVLSYKLDGYIPKLNIAIEYDEKSHKYYTYKQQEDRQNQIEKELGCKFIRIIDNKSDEENIGIVLRELFRLSIENNTYSYLVA